ncbi:L-lysine 6-monooxygenase (NADPH-requiring) [Rhizoctonia solani]|uniref:L-ornithine N(5)-monooxygenase [NAD(P)H] n=1 Tax=Rhizoctonia solani TaxID=456999 RepID=A0A8H7M3P2_9AGAM|nr:L-lysine 6-monooxygenase (NADPH-requiring) [Rhizoctonia solani]
MLSAPHSPDATPTMASSRNIPHDPHNSHPSLLAPTRPSPEFSTMATNPIHETSSIPGVDVASKGPNYNERYAGNEFPEVYDLLGIGFGPANLAITVALLELWDQHKAAGTEPNIKNACFIERHPRFSWHPGMLLPGSRMQISFLKDLATLRNPASKFTFLSYLHAHGRLPAFINRNADTPTRREYADYMAWAATRVRELGGEALRIRYGEDVVSVQSLDGGKTVTVTSRVRETNEVRIRNAKTLIIAPGGTARIPKILAPYADHPRVMHTSSYVQRAASLIKAAVESTGSSRSPSPAGSDSSRLSGLTTARALRIAVLGSGQSSAEVLLDLRSRLAGIPIEGEGPQEHQLDMIIRKGSLKPSDDSPFANEIFDPESTDKAFKLPSAARAWLRAEYAGTNYGVVNPRTIDALYEEVYAQKVDDAAESRPLGGVSAPDGTRVRINILSYQDTAHLSVSGSEMSNEPTFSIRLRHLLTGDEHDRGYDAIILGTGYERQSWMRLFGQGESKDVAPLSEVFGLTSLAPIRLLPVVEDEVTKPVTSLSKLDVAEAIAAKVQGSQPLTPPRSGATTPPSPAESTGSTLAEGVPPPSVRITRAYRLLPVEQHSDFTARVYVQGCAESSHGLSDTLLSVIGPRSGEVVADMVSA